MLLKKKLIFICLVGFLTIGFNNCKSKVQNEDENKIQEYYRILIENGEIKPLYSLEIIDKEKYDIIVRNIRARNLSANNDIIDYYRNMMISIICQKIA